MCVCLFYYPVLCSSFDAPIHRKVTVNVCVSVCLCVCFVGWTWLSKNDSLFKDYVDLQLGQAYPRFKDRDRVSPFFVLSFILLFENCVCFVTACNWLTFFFFSFRFSFVGSDACVFLITFDLFLNFWMSWKMSRWESCVRVFLWWSVCRFCSLTCNFSAAAKDFR